MRSFNNLNTAVDFAEIDVALFDLLKVKENRDVLRWTILNKYFPESKDKISGGDFGNNYLEELGNELLKESAEEYRNKLDELKHHMSNENYEEDDEEKKRERVKKNWQSYEEDSIFEVN